MSDNIKKFKKIFLSLFFVLLFGFTCFRLIPLKQTEIKEDLKTELRQELIENIGNYDSSKIVLKGTNKELAKEIADRLNAKLRITSDGSFATLSLRNGETILDVVSNKDNEDIIKYLSIDYQATESEEIEEQIDEESLHINAPNYTVTDPYYSKQMYLN